MKLTPRQSVFLRKLLDLYQERREPVHYSELAQKVGVNRFSAYDMLKVLERKGLAISEYALPQYKAGPGRSTILFRPTPQAIEQLRAAAVAALPTEEWAQLREELLTRLREARGNYQELLEELLARLPTRRSPLLYCGEMSAALLLNLQDLRQRVSGLRPLAGLLTTTSSARARLGTLAGLSLGSTLADRAASSLREQLLPHMRSYQGYLQSLSEENVEALSEFLQDVLKAIESYA